MHKNALINAWFHVKSCYYVFVTYKIFIFYWNRDFSHCDNLLHSVLCYHLGILEVDCPSHLDWVGDGSCDDTTNTIECNYDGGDCCGSNVNTAYCQQCLCLPNGSTLPSVPPTLFPTLTPGNNTGNNYCLMLYLSKTSFQLDWKGI